MQTNSIAVLQIRMFAYGSTQRYRLGVNFNQYPTNRPFYTYNPTRRDGFANVANYGAQQNYIPATNQPPIVKAAQYEQRAAHEEWIGKIVDFESELTDADFVQPREFWEVLGKTKDQQKNLVYNVAENLSGVIKAIRIESYGKFKMSLLLNFKNAVY